MPCEYANNETMSFYKISKCYYIAGVEIIYFVRPITCFAGSLILHLPNKFLSPLVHIEVWDIVNSRWQCKVDNNQILKIYQFSFRRLNFNQLLIEINPFHFIFRLMLLLLLKIATKTRVTVILVGIVNVYAQP